MIGAVFILLGLVLPMLSIPLPSIESFNRAAIVIADETAPLILTSNVPDSVKVNSTLTILLELDDGTEGSGIQSVICNITGANYEKTIEFDFISQTGASLETWTGIWQVPILTSETDVDLVYFVTDKAHHFTTGYNNVTIKLSDMPQGYWMINGVKLEDSIVTTSSPDLNIKCVVTQYGEDINRIEVKIDSDTIELVEEVEDKEWEATFTTTYGNHVILAKIYTVSDTHEALDITVKVTKSNRGLKDWDPRGKRKDYKKPFTLTTPLPTELLNIFVFAGLVMIVVGETQFPMKRR